MSSAARIGTFAALLLVVFATAAVAGSRFSPDVDDGGSHMGPAGGGTMGSHGADPKEPDDIEHGSHEETTVASDLPGLAVGQAGYRLVTGEQILKPKKPQTLTFRIEGDDGMTVSNFDVEHDRRMHLIVVRRDFVGFQHLHPKQGSDGSWSVGIEDLHPGVYRMFADFSTAGRPLTLAGDLFVPGLFEPKRLEPRSVTSDAGGGYEVQISSPSATGGETVPVEFHVTLNDRPIGAVQPYLGADGHLVALREGDQAFLHTHPEGEPGGTGPISFEVNYPTAGRYRLFLQFKHGGRIHTAAFTQIAEAESSQEGAEHG